MHDRDDLLRQAISNAETLLNELIEQQKDLERNDAPAVPPEHRAAGRDVMQNAIDAARRTLAALRKASDVAESD